MTPETASRAAAMVAKDYPFYLSVKRANCALDVEAASSPAKETEVLICWGTAATLFCLAACSALLWGDRCTWGMAAVRGPGFLATFSRRWNKTRSKGSRSFHLSL